MPRYADDDDASSVSSSDSDASSSSSDSEYFSGGAGTRSRKGGAKKSAAAAAPKSKSKAKKDSKKKKPRRKYASEPLIYGIQRIRLRMNRAADKKAPKVQLSRSALTFFNQILDQFVGAVSGNAQDMLLSSKGVTITPSVLESALRLASQQMFARCSDKINAADMIQEGRKLVEKRAAASPRQKGSKGSKGSKSSKPRLDFSAKALRALAKGNFRMGSAAVAMLSAALTLIVEEILLELGKAGAKFFHTTRLRGNVVQTIVRAMIQGEDLAALSSAKAHKKAIQEAHGLTVDASGKVVKAPKKAKKAKKAAAGKTKKTSKKAAADKPKREGKPLTPKRKAALMAGLAEYKARKAALEAKGLSPNKVKAELEAMKAKRLAAAKAKKAKKAK